MSAVPKVTILIPNYKTLTLTKLCLRLLRKYTNPTLARVIVIDNDSQDESLNYLRTLRWIHLIERPRIVGESAAASHSAALDLALAQVDTPFVLSIHTDTLVKRADWLEFLLQQIEPDPSIAGVGSWKLESKPLYRRLAKQVERSVQTLYYLLFNKENHAIAGRGKNYYYLRSHCALYRTALLRQLNTGFGAGDAVAGKVMHQQLTQAGYKMIFLSSEQLGQYVDHINHATMVLNPTLGARTKTIEAGTVRVQQRLEAVHAAEILGDARYDQ